MRGQSPLICSKCSYKYHLISLTITLKYLHRHPDFWDLEAMCTNLTDAQHPFTTASVSELKTPVAINPLNQRLIPSCGNPFDV